MRSSGLGKGLAALIPRRRGDGRAADPAAPPPDSAAVENTTAHEHRVWQIPSDRIDRNPEQPRAEFSEAELQDLAQSIRAHGILQPLVVTRSGDRFTLVAGERRLRAAKRAGLSEVPCLVHDTTTRQERLELSLIENVQRSDLHPLEQAIAYKRLHEEFGLSHEAIARAVGKERPSVSNIIRLLDLPPEMQEALRIGELNFSAARGLLAAKDPETQRMMFEKIRRGELSMRGLERATRRQRAKPHPRQTQQHPQLKLYEDELGRALGTRVRIKDHGHGGSIEVEYYSEEELSGIVDRLTRE